MWRVESMPWPVIGLAVPPQRLDHRYSVHDEQPVNGVGVVQSGSVGVVRAAVVTDGGEPLMAEGKHQCDDIGRHLVPGRVGAWMAVQQHPTADKQNPHRANRLMGVRAERQEAGLSP
jgi:hypothetical protein